MAHQDDIERLLARHRDRLQILKEKEATFGISTSPEILLDIRDIEAKIAKLESQLTEIEPSEESPWTSYVENLISHFEKWYIPNELQSLIDWDIQPVPVEDYIRLERVAFKPPLFPQIKEKVIDDNPPSQTIFQVLTQAGNEKMLIMGSAGAGKSTCLKYLCYKFAVAVKQQFENSANLDVIPVLITLRKYGPVGLKELIEATFRNFGVLVDKSQLDNILGNIQFIFLLDGLDEIIPERRDDLANELIILKEQYPSHKMIVTTRKQLEPPVLEDFKIYEVQPLDDPSIFAFVSCYLGSHTSLFSNQMIERKLDDFIRVPLLLTLYLIIFKLEAKTTDNIANIYQKIIELFRKTWEEPKRRRRTPEPIDWEIIEDSISFLAYRMIVDGIGYKINRSYARNILRDAIEEFDKSRRWSSKHSVYDLLEQLLTHNFLEAFGDEINFWHGSFRDFFAARHLIHLSPEQVVECTKSEDWALVPAFVSGLLPSPETIYQELADTASNLESSALAYWAVETLGLMGSGATPYIIRSVSEPIYMNVQYLARDLLYERRFQGRVIFEDVFGILSTIDLVNLGEWDINDLSGEFPNPDFIDFEFFTPVYKEIMLALSDGDIDKARVQQTNLRNYLNSLIEEEIELDHWLVLRDIREVDEFNHKLRSGKFPKTDLLVFCRNTILKSSLLYLEAILWLSDSPELRSEALLAMHCLMLPERIPLYLASPHKIKKPAG